MIEQFQLSKGSNLKYGLVVSLICLGFPYDSQAQKLDSLDFKSDR